MVARDKENLSGQQIGNYEIESHIAARKASDLFLARDVKLERLVFLEVLRTTTDEDENLATRFRRRMETVSQLKDPSIAVVSDFDTTDDGFPYAVIDYFPGTTLADKLADLRHSQQTLPVIEALELAKQIAHALGVAHTAGLIHHDLRPENIMLREDGAPVLIDLGLPVVLDPAAPGVNGSASEMLDYASPEELEGKQLTRRSNIYSLGVILYELLSGHRPKLPVLPFDIFPQANMPKEEPLEEARPGLAGETYRLVRNCLWRQEWSRFETADELITAIETSIFAEQELPKATGWGAPKRNRSLVYLIPVALLVLGLLGFLVLRGLRGGRAEAAEETPAAETTPSDVAGIDPTEPGQTASPTDTATLELPTESVGEASITVLSPVPGREFTLQDTINFAWYWPTLPEPGQHFAVYLIDGDSEHQLGALTEPNNGPSYSLPLTGEELPATGEELAWQVRLESVNGGEVQVASDPVPIIIRTAAPTAATTPEPGTPTVTPTNAEACVVSPPPGWVSYNVREGDALSDIAERANLEVETLIEVNCLTSILLSVGQPLWVPLAAVPRTPTPPAVPPTNPPPPTAGGSTPEPPPPSPTPGQQQPTETPDSPPTEEPTLTVPPVPTEPSPPPP